MHFRNRLVATESAWGGAPPHEATHLSQGIETPRTDRWLVAKPKSSPERRAKLRTRRPAPDKRTSASAICEATSARRRARNRRPPVPERPSARSCDERSQRTVLTTGSKPNSSTARTEPGGAGCAPCGGRWSLRRSRLHSSCCPELVFSCGVLPVSLDWIWVLPPATCRSLGFRCPGTNGLLRAEVHRPTRTLSRPTDFGNAWTAGAFNSTTNW